MTPFCYATDCLAAHPTLSTANRSGWLTYAWGDDELEVLALARLGWARFASGAVDAGIAVFDEAMATAGTVMASTASARVQPHQGARRSARGRREEHGGRPAVVASR